MAGLRRRWGALVVFGLAALIPLGVHDAFFLDSLVLILLWGALSAAWNVAGGYAGQVSLGHSAFFGIGAYAAALLSTRWQQSPWLGLVLGVVVSLAAGAVIGYLSNRLRGPYFALSTIAFSQVLLIVASRWRAFTAGSEGIPVPFRPGFLTLGLGHVAWVYVALVVALVYYGLSVYFERSRIGYQLAGVREDEDAAEALGIASRRLKIFAVVLSAALTSVCGTLWAQYVGFVDPFYVFSVDLSIRFALNTIIGGMGTALGPWLGSLLITSLETYLRATFAGVKTGFTGTYLIIYGCVLILVVRFVPEGLAGVAARLRARRGARHTGPEPARAGAAAAVEPGRDRQ
jgi:branched-chain amino acid transport system permease protein